MTKINVFQEEIPNEYLGTIPAFGFELVDDETKEVLCKTDFLMTDGTVAGRIAAHMEANDMGEVHFFDVLHDMIDTLRLS